MTEAELSNALKPLVDSLWWTNLWLLWIAWMLGCIVAKPFYKDQK